MLGLNMACGSHADIADDTWLNVDHWSDPEWARKPDALASAAALPFRDQVFDRLYLGHFLEHLEWPGSVDAIGAELRRVCKPGAEVRIVGPALDLAIRTGQPESLLERIRKDDDWRTMHPPGSGHAWTATVPLTVRAAGTAGFTDVKVIPVETVLAPEWPNPCTDPWQVALSAVVL